MNSGCVVVDCEHRHRTAARADDIGLAGQVAITIDTCVDAGTQDIGIREQTGRSVVDSGIGEGTTCKTTLVKLGRNARVVGERGDARIVNVQTVSEREDWVAGLSIVHDLAHKAGGELTIDEGGIGVTRVRGLIYLSIGTLSIQRSTGECDTRNATTNGCVGATNGAGERRDQGRCRCPRS